MLRLLIPMAAAMLLVASCGNTIDRTTDAGQPPNDLSSSAATTIELDQAATPTRLRIPAIGVDASDDPPRSS